MTLAGSAAGGDVADAADGPVAIAMLRQDPAAAGADRAWVTARGVVTRVGKRQQSCILQDETDGIYVGLDAPEGVAWDEGPEGAAGPETLAPGDVLEVSGWVEPGGFSPTLIARRARRLGPGVIPEPRPADASRFFQGAFDCTVVEVRGVVQSVRQAGAFWHITMEAFGRAFIADVAAAVVEGDPSRFIDGEVRVTGPTVSIFNTRGECVMPWVTVNRDGGFDVLSPPAHPPFESPAVPLTALAGFQPGTASGHRVRTVGTVVHVVPRKGVYLMEGSHGVNVLARATDDLRPGDVVEVAGFIDRSASVARIVNAELRQIATGDPPEPLAIAPPAIIAANATAARDAVKASPGDYEGCLVRFPARLLDTWDRAEGGLLSLATGDTTVTARVAAADFAKLRHIAPGSELLVTGIVELGWDFNPWAWPPRAPRSLDLLIRSAGDVAVVRAPPWWTPRRLSLVLGGATALLGLSLLWAWMLRREVTRQRALVDVEMRRRQEDEAAARDRERRAEVRSRQELEAKLTTSLAAAAVAHEIKLPLSNLLLASRLAEETLGPGGTGAHDIRRVLADIAAESGRVVTTIDRMRALLRNVQTEHAPTDIANVVPNALLQVRPVLEEHGIDLETAGLDASITVEGDAIQLQNAVANLLANAADAVTPLPAERRRIRVAIESRPAAVEIVVGDAGPGLPLEVPAKLPLHTTKAAGSGLGLFIVRTAAVNHGGSVSFGRSPLGGAEVRLVLPAGGTTPGQ